MGIILNLLIASFISYPCGSSRVRPNAPTKKKFWGLIFYKYYVVKNMNIMQTIQQIQMLLLNIRQIWNHILCFRPVETN